VGHNQGVPATIPQETLVRPAGSETPFVGYAVWAFMQAEQPGCDRTAAGRSAEHSLQPIQQTGGASGERARLGL
jgi:hypothetical protein